MASGWIVEEIILAQDGRTAKIVHYRCGPSLAHFFEAQHKQQEQSLQDYVIQLQNTMNIDPVTEIQQPLQQLKELLALPIEQLTNATQFLSHWSIEK